jgi:hypothetical protein
MRYLVLSLALIGFSCGDDTVANPDGPIDARIDARDFDAPSTIDGALTDAAEPDAAGLSCVDGVQDGDETDTDCGGSCPTKCGTGRGCNNMNDCQSHVCASGVCALPSCFDGVQNGLETDTDCGGADCDALNAQCQSGQHCVGNVDCVNGTCNNGTCN